LVYIDCFSTGDQRNNAVSNLDSAIDTLEENTNAKAIDSLIALKRYATAVNDANNVRDVEAVKDLTWKLVQASESGTLLKYIYIFHTLVTITITYYTYYDNLSICIFNS
jgi:hypothetical protein